MPYQASVTSTIQLATTSVTSANLGATLFAAAHNYFIERTRPYSTFDEVRNDPAIPSGSPSYNALRLAFSANGAATPIYLGRREVDLSTYTPDPLRAGKVTTYKISVAVGSGSVNAEYTSLVTDEAEEVCTGLKTAIDAATLDVTTTVVGTGAAAVLTLAASSTDLVIVTTIDNLTDSQTSTETAPDLLAALTEEAGEDFYFLTAEDHTETFVLAMAAEIEATESSNFPKQYHVAIQEANTIVPEVDPAIDTMGKLKELGYNRTSCRWHDEADTLFPEVFCTAFVGQFQPGATTWKFVIPSGITPAADPVTGKRLSTAKQGYIRDRNGSWFGLERGVNFNHGGTMASGEWIDVIQLKDWMNDQIEVRLTNLLLNQPGGKIPFTSAGKAQVTSVVDSVLKDAVDFGGLSGYVPTTVPGNTPFAEQAARILDQVEWTGYLAGAVHFILVSGTLTYEDASLV